MDFLIVLIIVFAIISIIVSILFRYVYKKRFIDIFDDYLLIMQKCKVYDKLLIKRVVQKSSLNRLWDKKEIPLEEEYNFHWTISLAYDVIEVYGIKKNNEFLIYKKNWSKENTENIKRIVNKINYDLCNNEKEVLYK